ncbi:hypothetical protein VE00_01576 [Pseudogymnoascus sp. WSF 3629]|nr:hypothetical protein VE00_01576 [Pseudogymnoascus sp. WSF 3629]
MVFYTIAQPDEYLAITGAGVRTVKIAKKGFIWPMQKCMRFTIQPRDYPMNLRAMTKEKLQFELPVVFTVGPDLNQRGDNAIVHGEASAEDREDRGDALMKYSMLLAGAATTGGHAHIESIVKGIIEGETRVLVSSMTMEEIFTEREQFKKRIYHNIQSELDQFGLKIYNANVKELTDAPNSNYFASLSRKAHEGASNQARVDVAEAQWHGNVGEAERQGRQNREIAKIHAETAVQKTERDTEKSQAEALLATRKAAFDRDVNIAKIEASRAVEVKDEQLRKDVESLRAATEIERLRASDVVKATILRESQQQASDARAYETQTKASADFFLAQKAAEARAYETQTKTTADADREKQTAQAKAFETQAKADADKFRVTRAAEATYVADSKKAEAEAYKLKVIAESSFLAEAKKADAEAYRVKVAAEAAYIKATRAAEANKIAREAEAEGLTAMAGAYAAMSDAFGGPAGLVQYLMLEKGVYGELARANAQAVQNLNPKVTVWNTGNQAGTGEGGEGGADAGASIRNVYQMLPPLMTTIKEQTGVELPEWQVGRLGGKTGGGAVGKAESVVVNGGKGQAVTVAAK